MIIINERNEHLQYKKLIREMANTAPSRKQNSTGNLEYLFSSKEIININQDW